MTRAATAAAPWSAVADGLRLRVRLTPRSAQDAVEGIEATAEGAALKVRVRAVPEDGAANAALAATVARWLGVPKSTVELVAGGKSRLKTLLVAGDGNELARRVSARAGRAA